MRRWRSTFILRQVEGDGDSGLLEARLVGTELLTQTLEFAPPTEKETSPQDRTHCSILACRNAVIVVLEGEGSIGAEAKFVTAGDVAWLTRGLSLIGPRAT